MKIKYYAKGFSWTLLLMLIGFLWFTFCSHFPKTGLFILISGVIIISTIVGAKCYELKDKE